jgi:galactosamine-6-phosphate isomerase
METVKAPDYETMSRSAAAHFREAVLRNPGALICFSTGCSPRRMYEILADDPVIRKSSIRALALDEWHGIEARHPATCRYFLERYVFEPWGIPESRQFVFNAAAPDPVTECVRMAELLKREGPIDLCVLGLGRNGHLGLNEPAECLHPHAHTAVLDEKSQTHPMLANEGVRLIRGMTFGMADLLQAEQILMLVCGADKREAVRDFMKEEVSTGLPASFLRLHEDTTVFLDASVL